jgi:hypothetical protein
MNYIERVSGAVRAFWSELEQQGVRQGAVTGERDRGNRSASTGGKQMDGFIDLIRDILVEANLVGSTIHTRHDTTLPGFFRPTKNWDIVVVVETELIAAIELKSHPGPSFGNNFNNRVEEAIGSSTDILTAFREGKFAVSSRPWLGWLMLLEQSSGSMKPVTAKESHFSVFPEFQNASYARRYELFCEKLMRERLYDGACLILSERDAGRFGAFNEPNHEFGFATFAASLKARAMAVAERRRKPDAK